MEQAFDAEGSVERIRLATGRGCVFVQGRMRPGVRLCSPGPADSSPRWAAGAAADELPGEGLRQFPHPDARPFEPALAGLERNQRGRPRRGSGGADGLCGRSAELPAGCRRHRGARGDRPQPGVAPAPCPAGRLSSAQRVPARAPGSSFKSPETPRIRCSSIARTSRFYTFAPGMPSSLAVGSGNKREAALSVAGVQVFEPMCDAVLQPQSQPDELLHLGRR